ncbi:MAG TPA: metal-dependent hydrolase [Nevskiaceae bacterium]|nr:metal-dependent hydrolase [Nevskiaceae bacterium]
MPALRTHEIPKRDLQFDFSKVDLLRWHGLGTIASHWFNVQSLMFPQGERYFIRSVRRYRDRIRDPQLQEQIAGFIAQEAMHGREHDAYNAALARAGYPVAWMERWVSVLIALAEKAQPPSARLAETAGLEHLTAIGAEVLLSNDDAMKDCDPTMAQLWRWHAVEETEHKAVAFDVHREIMGRGPFAWLQRSWTLLVGSIGMTFTTWLFLLVAAWRTRTLFDLRGWGRLLWALWIYPGATRRQVIPYFKYFSPWFHPWNSDNYEQVLRWRQGQISPAPGAEPLLQRG